MITENVLLFLGTLSAIVLGILLWNKFSPALKPVDLAQVDLSTPLRGRDLLTNEGILKLAYRLGIWKSVFLYWLSLMAVVGGTFYALKWGAVLPEVYSRFGTAYIVRLTLITSTISTIMMYRRITKTLHAFVSNDHPMEPVES